MRPVGSNEREEHENLLQFIYLTPVGIVQFTPDGRIMMLNPIATQLLFPLVKSGELTDLYATLSATLPSLGAMVQDFTGRSGIVCDKQRLQFGNSNSIVSLTVRKIDDVTLMAVIQDVTDLARQERQIFADQQRLRAIFENVKDCAIYTIDTEGRINEWNKSLFNLGGWERGDVFGQHIRIFYPELSSASVIEEALAQARISGSAEIETWRTTKNGGKFWGHTVVTTLADPAGDVHGFVVVTRDMTERHRREVDLLRLATTDSLTGAVNRRYGQTVLEQEHARAVRFGSAFVLGMLDIDEFKRINDRFGHAIGDKVLTTLVEVSSAVLRRTDMLVRWGGEEFLILLPETAIGGAQEIAERLRISLQAASDIAERGIPKFTVSIGLVGSGRGNVDDLLRRADEALYRAKAEGRNRVVIAES